MSLRFKEFMQQHMSSDGMGEEKKDIQNTLDKIPQSHRNLVKGYRWKFHAGNTLNGDDEHVGYIDDNDKEIAVASPWGYGREFCALHEIAHKVLDNLPANIKHQWATLFNRTKNKQINTADEESKGALDQSPEEIFCMCYATFYSKHKNMTYANPQWMEFIKNLPQ